MTKEQLDKLAKIVRTTPDSSAPSVMWAVKHHLALFIWGIENAETTLNAILLACNSNREDGIVSVIGLDELEKLKGARLLDIGKYNDLFVVRENSVQPDEL